MPEKPPSTPPDQRPTLEPPPHTQEEMQSDFLVTVSAIAEPTYNPESKKAKSEDSFFEKADASGKAVTAFVADGMGGHPGGDIASETVKKTVARENRKLEKIQADRLAGKSVGSDVKAELAAVEKIMQDAIDDIRIARDLWGSTYDRMGTTGTLMRIIRMPDGTTEAVIGHIGDSRAYLRYEDGTLEALTLDAHPSYMCMERKWGTEKALRLQAIVDNIDSLNHLEKLQRLFDGGKPWPETEDVTKEEMRFLIETASMSAEEASYHLPLDFFQHQTEYADYAQPVLAYYFLRRSTIQQAFGAGGKPRVFRRTVPKGASIFLTTDGVHDQMRRTEMEAVLGKKGVEADPILMAYAQDGTTRTEHLTNAALARAKFEAYSPHGKGADDMVAIEIEIQAPPALTEDED